jgi:dUTP pyrophosphatase
MIPVKIVVTPGATVPQYQTSGAAGADICAFVDEDVVIDTGATALIPTGLYIEVPDGYEAQIRPRSGLALNHGITLLNSPGTIDADYRGEIKIITTNLGREPFVVRNGMRIAQIVFNKIYRGHFIETVLLAESGRSQGGFGHSGI